MTNIGDHLLRIGWKAHPTKAAYIRVCHVTNEVFEMTHEQAVDRDFTERKLTDKEALPWLTKR